MMFCSKMSKSRGEREKGGEGLSVGFQEALRFFHFDFLTKFKIWTVTKNQNN